MSRGSGWLSPWSLNEGKHCLSVITCDVLLHTAQCGLLYVFILGFLLYPNLFFRFWAAEQCQSPPGGSQGFKTAPTMNKPSCSHSLLSVIMQSVCPAVKNQATSWSKSSPKYESPGCSPSCWWKVSWSFVLHKTVLELQSKNSIATSLIQVSGSPRIPNCFEEDVFFAPVDMWASWCSYFTELSICMCMIR